MFVRRARHSAVTLPEQYTSRSAFARPLAQLLLLGGLCLVADSLTIRPELDLALGECPDGADTDAVLPLVAGGIMVASI